MNITSGAVAGLIVAFFLGLVTNYVFESLGLNARAARTNERRARKRLKKLEAEHLAVTEMHNDSMRLVSFLLGNLVLVNALWIFSTVIGNLFYLGYNVERTSDAFGSNGFLDERTFEQYSSTSDAASSATGSLLMMSALLFSFRAFVRWRHVQKYARFDLATRAEILDLRTRYP